MKASVCCQAPAAKKSKEKQYKQRKDNEWFVIGDNTKLVCCDCGLVHKIKFRVKNNLFWMKAVRLEKETKKWRKQLLHNKIRNKDKELK